MSIDHAVINLRTGGVGRATLGQGVGALLIPVTGAIQGNDPFEIVRGGSYPPEYDYLSTELQSVISTVLSQPNASKLVVYRINDAGTDGSDVVFTKETSSDKPDGIRTTFGVVKGPVSAIDAIYLNLNKQPGDPDAGDQLLKAGQDDFPPQGGSAAVSFVITGVGGTFTLSGDHTVGEPELATGKTLTVSGSTGNDGTYTIFSVTLNTGNTDVVVTENVPDATADGTASWGSSEDNYDINYDQGQLDGTFTLKGTWQAPSGTMYDASVTGSLHFPPPGSTVKISGKYKNTQFILSLRNIAESNEIRFVNAHYPGMADGPSLLVPGSSTGVYTGTNSGGGTLLDDYKIIRNTVIRANLSSRFMHCILGAPLNISASDLDTGYGDGTKTYADWVDILGGQTQILVTANTDEDVSSAFMGLLMGLPPQANTQLQRMVGIFVNRYDRSKVGALEDAGINVIDKHRIIGDTIAAWTGLTCSKDPQLKWIDDSRVKMELRFELKVRTTQLLADPTVGQNVVGMTRIRSRVKSVLDWAVGKSMIDGYPLRGSDTIPPFCVIPLEESLIRIANGQGTQSDLDLVAAVKETRIVSSVAVTIFYSGTPRQIIMNLGAI